MIWNYRCPNCNGWRSYDWESRNERIICGACDNGYSVPTPSEQPRAYVDTHNWPVEMETEVVNRKGNNCTVPGCRENYETLDHRIAFSNDGETSVENLYPMCNSHNQSKGNTDYQEWLNGQ